MDGGMHGRSKVGQRGWSEAKGGLPKRRELSVGPWSWGRTVVVVVVVAVLGGRRLRNERRGDKLVLNNTNNQAQGSVQRLRARVRRGEGRQRAKTSPATLLSAVGGLVVSGYAEKGLEMMT